MNSILFNLLFFVNFTLLMMILYCLLCRIQSTTTKMKICQRSQSQSLWFVPTSSRLTFLLTWIIAWSSCRTLVPEIRSSRISCKDYLQKVHITLLGTGNIVKQGMFHIVTLCHPNKSISETLLCTMYIFRFFVGKWLMPIGLTMFFCGIIISIQTRH